MFNKIKQKRQEEKEQKLEDQAFEAKLAIKQNRKGIETFIKEAQVSVDNLTSQAIEAKKKGYEPTYKLILGQLRIAESRRRQAEAFLFQLDAMSEADKLAKASGNLLTSMNLVMGAMGQLSFDRNAILESQKTFAKSSQNLEKQSEMLEKVMMGMDMNVEMAGVASVSEDEIEAGILSRMVDGVKNTATITISEKSNNVETAVSASADKEIAELRRMVNKN